MFGGQGQELDSGIAEISAVVEERDLFSLCFPAGLAFC